MGDIANHPDPLFDKAGAASLRRNRKNVTAPISTTCRKPGKTGRRTPKIAPQITAKTSDIVIT